MPETSNGPVRPFQPWLSPAILPQRPTAASAGGGFAPSMPRMRPGTSASSSRARKEAKVSFRLRGYSGVINAGPRQLGWVKLLSKCLAKSKHKEERAASLAAAAPMCLKSQLPTCLSFRWACSFRCNRPLQSVGGYRYEVRFQQRLRCLQLFRLLQRLLALLGHFILLHLICPAGHRCSYMQSGRQSLLANREHVRTTF